LSIVSEELSTVSEKLSTVSEKLRIENGERPEGESPQADHPTGPSVGKGRQVLTWLQQRPGATGRWIGARPWLFLPLLAVFPAIAWNLDRNRPPAAHPNTSLLTPRPQPSNIPLGSLMTPGTTSGTTLATTGLATPLPSGSPTTPVAGTPSPSPTPVDLTKLTPEQKAMNAKAKAALLGAGALVDAQIEMHVAIATKAPAVAVGSPSAVDVSDAQGKVLFKLAAGEIYTAQPDAQGMTIGDQSLPADVFLNSPETGVLMVSGRPYRGKLRLVSQQGRLWAISFVNMRNYLQSVVASEVSPNWGKEALKAQAVAARSYALTYYFKPANALYHLGNDEYYQVYSGIEREAPETSNAVDETSGEFVSYKGGIVESLYAASDDIVAEAFAGKGMSQLGAKDLSTQGYKYEQILGYYYPSTAVGKIVQEF
jgi:stage II sporulation protein D